MPTRRCRTARALRPVVAPLLCVQDALDVIFAAADEERSQVLALLLDDDHVGATCMVVEDVTAPDQVLDVASVVVSARERTPVAALVLASVRPGGWIDEDDLYRWDELCDLVEPAGLRLLDWFVVADGMAASLRELSGGPDEWTPPARR
jgi:hypothetical protein